ncbi:MAG: hypothetical protein AB8F78_18225 [Saprospiraceae bacterium]
MIEFIKANKVLTLSLLLSIGFFLRKGIQYGSIGSFVPLFIVMGLIALLACCIRIGLSSFALLVKSWAVALIAWSCSRLVISGVHLSAKPFDGSFHMTQQFGIASLVLTVAMLSIGVLIFSRSSKKSLGL